MDKKFGEEKKSRGSNKADMVHTVQCDRLAAHRFFVFILFGPHAPRHTVP